jgi:Protein of unknown function (DUF4245)
MSKETLPRRRSRSGQDGVGSRAAVVSAAVAVALVAGGGWAFAHAGNDDKTTDTGAPQTSTPSTSPSAGHTHGPAKDKDKSWSKQCGRAATAASRAGIGVLAPAELPSGWSLGQCRYSTATGWHLEVTAAGQSLTMDQRKGEVAPVVAAVLGSGSHPGSDVHAAGTGTWQSWTGSGGKHALSRGLSSSGIVLSGPVPVATLQRFAGVLLTYESAPNSSEGG